MSQDRSSAKDLGASPAKGKESKPKPPRRTYRAQGLSRLVPKILKDGLGRKGSLEADLLLHWREVVGEEHAQWTVPTRISYADRRMRRKGTLELSVAPAYAAFAQMAEAEIISGVNQFLGYGRIERLQLRQSHAAAGQAARSRSGRGGSSRRSSRGSSRGTVTNRGPDARESRVMNRQERRNNDGLSDALESLRTSIDQRERDHGQEP